MKIITGGQSGVDRAAMDFAIRHGLPYTGWCPRGGWAEDFPTPPGLLAKYPLLRETPLADPSQRTEWNVRDSDAVLIIAAAPGLPTSRGTELARDLAAKHCKACLVVDVSDRRAVELAAGWLGSGLLRYGSSFALGIGGPRESEAPGIYSKATKFLHALIQRVQC
jgi:hypothetical protein